MQFIVVVEMIETNAKTKRKIEKKRKSTRIKKKNSAEVQNFENFDFEKSKTCKDLFLTQKTSIDLYDKLIVFSNKFLLKAMRIDFVNMC